MRSLSIAVTQMACSASPSKNIERAVALVERAAAGGAQVVVLQDPFETPYFCIARDARHRDVATTIAGNAAVGAMRDCARRLGIVSPVSFCERGGGFSTECCGGSFIADETGRKVAELGEADGEVAVHGFDLDRIREFRKGWGVFRTRRPDLYGPLIDQMPPDYLMKR